MTERSRGRKPPARQRYRYKAAVALAETIRAETMSLSLSQRHIAGTIAHLVVTVGLDGLDDTAGQIAEAAGMKGGSALSNVAEVWKHLEAVGLVESQRRPNRRRADGTMERGTLYLRRFTWPRERDVYSGAVLFEPRTSTPDLGDFSKQVTQKTPNKSPRNTPTSTPDLGDTHSSSIDTHRAADSLEGLQKARRAASTRKSAGALEDAVSLAENEVDRELDEERNEIGGAA